MPTGTESLTSQTIATATPPLSPERQWVIRARGKVRETGDKIREYNVSNGDG